MNIKKHIILAKELFYDLFEETGGQGYRYNHSLVCLDIAKKVRRKIKTKGIDWEIVYLGCLFHDIGKSIKSQNKIAVDKNHNDLSIEELQNSFGKLLPPEKIKILKQIIFEHSIENPKLVESLIVRDCDMASKFGVSEIWRLFNFSGQTKRNAFDTIKDYYGYVVPKREKMLKKFYFLEIKEIALKRLKEEKTMVKKFQNQFCLE